tara:strand:- start:435 stop:632 length:198 start_codon:yes stop_codon:yes gene_type:complete
MGKNIRIITVDDERYEVLGTQSVQQVDEEGSDVWKDRWGADTILRNGDLYYFCRKVIEAEFKDIK